jgi:hypothetical protein
VDTESWTLDELARRAGQALAADAVHAPNGRVRERPDGRAIRWYATIGLVDRPLAGPGRGARYGPRHLLQLVAVKRLQALGRSLAQIQAELTGATDATLRRIAELPADLAELSYDTVSASAPNPGAGTDTDTDGAAANAPVPARFWAAAPVPTGIAAPSADSAPARSGASAAAAASAEPAHDGEPIAVRYQIALSDTVSLTVPNLPDAAGLEAVREAAAPLLRLLAARDLTTAQGVQDDN